MLSCNPDPIALRRGGAAEPLFLTIAQSVAIVEDDRYLGEWRCRTTSYAYWIRAEEDGNEVFFFHWDSGGQTGPHVHVAATHDELGPIHRIHIPTGRVSFEAVLRMLIDDLDVQPNRGDWRAILGEAAGRFERFRTWS